MFGWLLLLVGLVIAFYALLWAFQERLIYYPRRYPLADGRLPPLLERVDYRTTAGAQSAIYLPPKARAADGTAVPERLWLVFGGNAMVALDWRDWADRSPDLGAAYLLIDYPGYGHSEGVPNRARITESAPQAFAALAARLETTPEVLASRTRLLGHSLGAAAALEFATLVPLRGIVLTAPFTSLRDMVSKHYGPIATPLLRDRWDNAARLAELGAQATARPLTVIVHGESDEVIPFELGQRLARGAPWTRFVPVPLAHHNDLFDVAPEVIRAAMAEVATD